MPTPRGGNHLSLRDSLASTREETYLRNLRVYMCVCVCVCTYWAVHEGIYADDNARCTRGGGTRVRRKQLNLVLSSLSFSFAGYSRRRTLPPLFFLFLPLPPRRPLPAKLNKHSYLHSISGALTSLDNPATDSSSSHVRTYVCTYVRPRAASSIL